MPPPAASHKNSRTVSLVLGSGGARGLAHIGVIKWLEEHGFRIVSISGCSMGALVGGIYAAGKLEEFETWARAIDKMSILGYLDISWRASGFVRGDKIIDTLVGVVGDWQIEDLPIAYTAVAANLDTGKEVWFQSGRLFEAIRASISLPFFFTAFDYNGQRLVDGGVLNPVPIAPTFGDQSDMTLSVNLGGDPEEIDPEPPEAPAPESSWAEINDKIARFFKDLSADEDLAETKRELGVFEVGLRAFDAMQNTIARQKLAAYPPDFELTIPRNICETLDFHLANEVIAFGYLRAAKKLGHLL
ncbi:MAG: patatin-like phospholipase family protein [Bacteroidota bacterium]